MSEEEEETKTNTAAACPPESALLYAGRPGKTKYDDPEYCNKCGEKSNLIEAKDYDSGVLSEARTVCDSCGHDDYWAFGFFESGSEMVGKAKKYSYRAYNGNLRGGA